MARYETVGALLAEAEAHLAFWKQALFLERWSIQLRAESTVAAPSHDGVRATISYDEIHHTALLRLDESYWLGQLPVDTQSPVRHSPDLFPLEETILHELMHLILMPWMQGIEATSEYAPGLLVKGVGEGEEQHCSLMARILARLRAATSKAPDAMEGGNKWKGAVAT